MYVEQSTGDVRDTKFIPKLIGLLCRSSAGEKVEYAVVWKLNWIVLSPTVLTASVEYDGSCPK